MSLHHRRSSWALLRRRSQRLATPRLTARFGAAAASVLATGALLSMAIVPAAAVEPTPEASTAIVESPQESSVEAADTPEATGTAEATDPAEVTDTAESTDAAESTGSAESTDTAQVPTEADATESLPLTDAPELTVDFTEAPTQDSAPMAALDAEISPMAIPAPTATTAVISVRVGSDRIAGTPISATGLAGVTLRLSSSSTNPSAWSAYPWATCISDAAGDCSFTIPIKTSGITDSTGMFHDQFPWVHQVSAPTGYHLVTNMRVGAGDGSGSIDFPYRFQVAQRVSANTVYQSTSTAFRFMITSTDPADQNTSAGTWQVARNNPAVQQRCGLNYAVLMDLSGSINATELAQSKSAVDTFIDALVGTPSSVALFNFDGTSPANATEPNLPTLRSVRTTAEATAVKSSYASWVTGSGTNWDAGLYAVATAAPAYDVVVVITDGNPTQFGSTVPDRTTSSPNRVRDNEAGIFSANLVKAEGTRVVAVGVGPGAAGISALNLQAISGPVANSDYYQVSDFVLLADQLATLARGQCDATIDVLKRVIPAGAVIPANPTAAQLDAISAPAEGWTITGTTTASGVSIGTPAGPYTTDEDGIATIPLRFTHPTTTGPVTVREVQQAGFELQPVTVSGTARNAECVNTNTGGVVSTTDVVSSTTPGVTVTANTQVAIECTIYNKVPSAPEIVLEKSASVVDVDGDGVTGLGDHILYSFEVTNTGNVTVNGVAIVDDLLSAQDPSITVTCAPTSIAPTEVSDCVADDPYVITQADVDAREVVNVATARGTDTTGTPVVSNPDDTLTPVELFRVLLQLEKIGEDVAGDWTRMDGSTWAILEDDNGAPGVASALTIDAVSTGFFEIADVPSGVYWLTELTAPDGFSLLAQPVQFMINPDRTVSILADSGGGAVTADGQLITVRDVPALVMPETGGSGNSPFQLGGSALLLTAGVMALMMRRRARAQVV